MNESVNLTMDMLLNIPPEEFIKIMSDQTTGFKTSLANLIKVQYEQCKVSKDALNTLLVNNKIPKQDMEQCNATLENLYISMQLLEDRYNILNILLSGTSTDN